MKATLRASKLWNDFQIYRLLDFCQVSKRHHVVASRQRHLLAREKHFGFVISIVSGLTLIQFGYSRLFYRRTMGSTR